MELQTNQFWILKGHCFDRYASHSVRITLNFNDHIYKEHVMQKKHVTCSVLHWPKNSEQSDLDVNGTRLFGSFHWKFSGINGIPEKVATSQWKFVFHLQISRLYCFLSRVRYFSRSIKRPGIPRPPRMELVANGTRSSQTEIPNINFSNVFINGQRPHSSHLSIPSPSFYAFY